ncbi:class A beta-lactamase-related serine hydrolase [Luteimonas kalidii]|uniref:Class A beta-lactamase-related serine hydrolase n=1 Tax=Luteimonas kalidii TaxID=3042025 RepID=A0ABT6JPZ5_9GAMM|nr:class A beta-lactamase-related serine hydrolase [Luteimonas kalidii]MDH5832697.1 class A beta-lactamase-related serine hydrolase [Luteimonas kalidii]
MNSTPTRRARPWAATLPSIALLALLAACRDEPPGPVERQADARSQAPDPAWVAPLDAAVERIDAAMPGEFGVYVARFGDRAGTLDRGDGRRWYLSSTVKVPVAIAVLEEVDAGRMSLDEEVELQRSDFVDGAGDMLAQPPGNRFSIATLLEKSLRDSDSTATDMLIRRLGEGHLDARLAEWVGDFGPLTTILQVRYDAYGALHPDVASLDNLQIVALRNAEAGEPRLQALASALDVERDALPAGSLQDAFENYYATGANAATLPAFARLLERLVAGELLSAQSTALLLGHMRAITTGDRRIAAGLPPGTDFAQKTGTQLGRACNVGIVEPDRGTAGATVVVACAERFDELAQAEQAFQALGRALGETVLAPGPPAAP